MNIRRLWREPLLHFMLIGLGLFLLYGRVAPGDSESRRIVVSQNHVDDMVRQYQSAWHRAPTPPEVRGLIDTYVRDEIAYREGRSMGLEKDDAVIKRRIRQKYDLIAEEEERAEPTDADLEAYLKARPATFIRSARVGFDQIYFDPRTTTPEVVAAVKAALMKGANPAKFGQPTMLPRRIADSPIDLAAREFGEDFARQVGTAPIGQWVGPIASGFGVHLVKVNERSSPQVPPLDQVRPAVAREWESDRRIRSSEANYRKARAGYDVIIKAGLP